MRPCASASRTAFSISRWALTPSVLRNFRMLVLNTSSFIRASFGPPSYMEPAAIAARDCTDNSPFASSCGHRRGRRQDRRQGTDIGIASNGLASRRCSPCAAWSCAVLRRRCQGKHAMLTIRIGVIAAAFLALSATWVQARDCERYPTVCEQPEQTKTTADPAPRAAPVQKREARAVKRPVKSRTAAKSSRVTVREQRPAVAREQPPDVPAPSAPAPRLAAGTTAILDAAVMLPQSLAETAATLAADGKGDSVAPMADAPVTSLPADDAGRRAAELPPAHDAEVANAIAGVRFVDADQVNELDLAAAGPQPTQTP